MNIAELTSRVTICYSLSDLAKVEKDLTMSSREIADLTGKEHFNVLRDIRSTLEDLDIDPAKFEASYLDSQGRQQSEFVLDEELALTVVSGYSTALRNLIVRQWLEMRGLIRTQQHEIDQLRKAEITWLKGRVTREANAVQTAKTFSALVKPSTLKKYRSTPELQALAIQTFELEQKYLKDERKFADLYDNVVKELVNTQDKLKELNTYATSYCKLRPEYSGMRYPYLLEVLAYSRPLSNMI